MPGTPINALPYHPNPNPTLFFTFQFLVLFSAQTSFATKFARILLIKLNDWNPITRWWWSRHNGKSSYIFLIHYIGLRSQPFFFTYQMRLQNQKNVVRIGKLINGWKETTKWEWECLGLWNRDFRGHGQGLQRSQQWKLSRLHLPTMVASHLSTTFIGNYKISSRRMERCFSQGGIFSRKVSQV